MRYQISKRTKTGEAVLATFYISLISQSNKYFLKPQLQLYEKLHYHKKTLSPPN